VVYVLSLAWYVAIGCESFSPIFSRILISFLFNVFILRTLHQPRSLILFIGFSVASELISFSKNRSTIMTRGNQRDRDRERAQARTGGGKGKQGKADGLTPEQRRERDAKALQEKAAKKAAQDAAGNNAGGSKK
ncbi:uncharacterized protein LOC109806014, partial [Cajanus cajan]|uniref:uncharacterized protein LOC109806014 n=1 Tax=Cajanus cajan TaxID=3821 RepID=UPI0010FAF894